MDSPQAVVETVFSADGSIAGRGMLKRPLLLLFIIQWTKKSSLVLANSVLVSYEANTVLYVHMY